MNTPEKESALSRWSRRKHQSTHAPEALSEDIDLGSSDMDAAIDNEITASEEENQEDLHCLTDDDMPDLESLNEESDFSGFLSKNVSDTLRKQALRKLFCCDTYNVCDGLDDYASDYTKFEKLDPSIITADMKHRLEMEAQKQMEQMEQIAEEDQADSDIEAEVDPELEGDEDAVLASHEEPESVIDDLDDTIDPLEQTEEQTKQASNYST